MDRPGYFQTALSNFAMEAACGGAVRHLTDIGYTLDRIVERLDYPAPRDKVQRIMMEYLYESRVLLKREPSREMFAAEAHYVQEQDAYGRRTMRKVVDDHNSQFKAVNMPAMSVIFQDGLASGKQEFIWKETAYDFRRDGKLTEVLHRKCEENGEAYSYMSCSFGFLNNDQNSQEEMEIFKCLNSRQREYLRGIRWENSVLYHRLNRRMLEIIGKLYEAGIYSGVCFFITKQEKLLVVPQ